MRRIGSGVITLALSIFLTDADVAQAQVKPGPLTGRDVSAPQIAERLPAGSRARLVIHGERLIAWNASIVGDSISAAVHGKPSRIALSDIDTMWIQTGTRALPGAFLVGVPFAAAGAIFGVGASCMEAPCQHSGEAGTTVGLVLGALGAAAGGILGSMITRWSLIFVRGPSPGGAVPTAQPLTLAPLGNTPSPVRSSFPQPTT
jgi:hypothetical protein